MHALLRSLARDAVEFLGAAAVRARAAGLGLWRIMLRIARAAPVRRVLAAAWACARSTLRVAGASAALALLALGALYLGFERVPVGAIGVRQTAWGESGVEPVDHPAGLHASARGFYAWHFLDGRTHFLTFGWESDGCAFPVLDLRTRDGNEVKISVTVPYRIVRGEGWQLVRDGLKSSYASVARSTTESLLMQDLANLSSTELADSDVRLARCAEALPKLNALLAPYHLEAESIQIHQTLFWVEYEKKLQQKQLVRQLALEAQAAAEVEEQRRAETLADLTDAEEKRIRGEMDVRLEELQADSQRAIAALKREAQSYDELRRVEAQSLSERELAEGNLALARAEALRDRLTHQVYESTGGRVLLAREAAQNLRIQQVTLDSSDPRVPSVLDLDEMVALMIGKPRTGEQTASR